MRNRLSQSHTAVSFADETRTLYTISLVMSGYRAKGTLESTGSYHLIL